MSIIRSRLDKLEATAALRGVVMRDPANSDAVLTDARRVAGVCDQWEDVAAYLRTRTRTDANVISLDRRQHDDAVIDAAARAIFDEAGSSA